MAATGEEVDAASSPLDRRLAPLLLFDHDGKMADGTQASDGDATLFFFYSIPSEQLLRNRLAEMEGHRYWTTPQGCLLMQSRTSPATFLWDPFTGARIDLPADLDGFLRGDGPKRCLLSSNPVAAACGDQDCLVLVVDLAKTVLWYCRLGIAGEGDDAGRWLKHEYEPAAAGGAALEVVLWAIRRLTSVGGKFFMILIDSVVRLDFSPAGPLFAMIPADMNAARWRPPSGGGSTTELVESQGSLFCVSFSSSDFHMRFVAGIVVFELNLATQAWVRSSRVARWQGVSGS